MSFGGDYKLEDTVYIPFTTRAFATGIPTALVSGEVQVYEDASITQITASETLSVSLDSVAGFNMVAVAATAANGFETGKSYTCILAAGTVDSVSAIGEVVGHFTLEASAAYLKAADVETDTQDLQTQVGTDGAGLTNMPWNASWDTEVQSECTDALNAYDPPTRAELTTDVNTIVTDLDDIKGTGFVKDTDSLVDILADTSDLQTNQGNWLTATGFSTSAALSTAQTDLDKLTGADGATLATTQANYAPAKAGDSMALTAAAVDAVWDEDLSPAHDTAGSAGKALQDAGAAGDPWSTALPGAYGAGTAGEILGDWKDAGRLDAILDVVAADVVNIDGIVPAAAGDAMALTTGGVNQIWDETLAAHVTADSSAAHLKYILEDTQTTLDTKINTIDGIVDNILLDTAEIGAAGDGLTAINLPNQTMDIIGSITGNLSGSVGSVTGAVGSVAGNVDGSTASVTGAVGSVTGAVGSVTGAVGSVTATVNADVVSISGDSAAADSLEASMETLVVGTANGGTTSTVTVASPLDSGDDTFNGRVLIFRSGTALTYEAGVITDYNGTTGTFTFAADTWTTAPTDELFVIV